MVLPVLLRGLQGEHPRVEGSCGDPLGGAEGSGDDSIGFRLTMATLQNGFTRRPCECPAHIGLPCNAQRMEDCGCHRHVGGQCGGLVDLNWCLACEKHIGTRGVVPSCGCRQCEPCAIDTMLSKSWAADMTTQELLAHVEWADDTQMARVGGLIEAKRAAPCLNPGSCRRDERKA